MQIINLCKASFVLGFHKHRLHFFYSFSKIMLLFKRSQTTQKWPGGSKHSCVRRRSIYNRTILTGLRKDTQVMSITVTKVTVATVKN